MAYILLLTFLQMLPFFSMTAVFSDNFCDSILDIIKCESTEDNRNKVHALLPSCGRNKKRIKSNFALHREKCKCSC